MDPKKPAEASPRKPYVPPKLQPYGRVEDMTRAIGPNGKNDSAPGGQGAATRTSI